MKEQSPLPTNEKEMCSCHCHNNHEGSNVPGSDVRCKCLPNCEHCNPYYKKHSDEKSDKEKHTTSRRLKILTISNVVLMKMFEQGHVMQKCLIEKGLPRDAKVRDVRMKFHEDAIQLKIESESFDEAPEGKEIPEFQSIIIKRLQE